MDTTLDGTAGAESEFYEKFFDCKRLENVTTKDIPDAIKGKYWFDPAFISYICDEFDLEAEAAKRRLNMAYIRLGARAEVYIQIHQVKFMEMAGDLWRYIYKDKPEPEMQDTGIYHICQHLYEVVEDLLNFLEANSSHYNRETWIIPRYRAIHVYHFKSQESTFLYILKKHKIDEYLINILTGTVRNLIDDQNAIKLHTLKYLYTLQERITKFAPSADEATEALQNLLLSINFNGTEYYEYIIRYLHNKIIHMADDSTRLDGIYVELQNLTLQDIAHAPLYTNLPGLIPRLTIWLEAQLRIYQSRLKLKPALPEPNAMVYPMEHPEQTPLPEAVEHIALWARLVKEGYNLPMSKKEMVQLVINLFRSKRSGANGIAAKSLSNAMAEPDDKTLDAVEKMLQRMLNMIREIRSKSKNKPR